MVRNLRKMEELNKFNISFVKEEIDLFRCFVGAYVMSILAKIFELNESVILVPNLEFNIKLWKHIYSIIFYNPPKIRIQFLVFKRARS